MARSIEPCVNEMLVRDDAHHMTPTRSGSAEPDTTPSWGWGLLHVRCSTTPDFGMVELELSPTIPKTIPESRCVSSST